MHESLSLSCAAFFALSGQRARKRFKTKLQMEVAWDYSPDCLMAIQESWLDDMASRVRLMSSLSWVPSIDSSEYTISTWWRKSLFVHNFLFFSNQFPVLGSHTPGHADIKQDTRLFWQVGVKFEKQSNSLLCRDGDWRCDVTWWSCCMSWNSSHWQCPAAARVCANSHHWLTLKRTILSNVKQGIQ